MVLLRCSAFLVHISPVSRPARRIASLVFCLFLFFQTLIFRKKLSVAGKGNKVQNNLLLSYFAFGWFLIICNVPWVTDFFFPLKISNQDKIVLFIQVFVFIWVGCF